MFVCLLDLYFVCCYHLLAPTGALIVIVCYYRSGYFLKFWVFLPIHLVFLFENWMQIDNNWPWVSFSLFFYPFLPFSLFFSLFISFSLYFALFCSFSLLLSLFLFSSVFFWFPSSERTSRVSTVIFQHVLMTVLTPSKWSFSHFV